MASEIKFPDGIRVATTIRLDGSPTIVPGFTRSNLVQESLAVYPIPFESLRVHDAFGTLLPASPATDDLGLVGGTFGTGVPSIQTGDLKAAGATTRYARTTIALPIEYDAAADVVLRLHAGMLTTVADTSSTIDVEAYLSDQEAAVDGADKCATAATTINSLSLADKDFVITATSLSPGDLLDIRIAIAINDAASVTAVTGILGAASLLCDVRG